MQNDYTQGTKTRRTKRYLVGILVLVLVLAISATALADNGRGAGGNGGQPKPGGLSSQPPQGTPDPASTTDGRRCWKPTRMRWRQSKPLWTRRTRRT